MGCLDGPIIPLSATLDMSRPPSLAPVQIADLGYDLCAVFHPLPTDWKRLGKRLEYTSAGRLVSGPIVGTQVELLDCTVRNVAFLKQRATRVLQQGIAIRLQDRVVAQLDPEALQSPWADPLAVSHGLSRHGASRLLRLLLTAGASLVGDGEIAGFDRVLPHVLRAAQAEQLPLVSYRPLGRCRCLGTWRLAAHSPRPDLTEMLLLSDGRVKRLPPPEIVSGGHDRRLDLVLPLLPPPGARLVGFTPDPLILEGQKPEGKPAHIYGWYRRCAADARGQLDEVLARAAESDPVARAQLAELRSTEQHQPRARMRFSAATRLGVLFGVSIDDPLALVKGLRFFDRTARHTMRVAKPLLHPVFGPVHIGYFRWRNPLREAPNSLSFDLVTRTDRILRQDAFFIDGSRLPVSELCQLDFPDAHASELADALEDSLAERPPIALGELAAGSGSFDARTAICVTPRADQDYLRAVLTSLVQLGLPANLAIVLILSSDTEAAALKSTIAQARAICRVPISVALAPEFALPSEILRAVAAQHRSRNLVWLDPGVLPRTAGWAQTLRRKLSRARAALVVRAPVTDINAGATTAPDGGHFGTFFGLSHLAVERLREMPLLAMTTRGTVSALCGAMPARATVWDAANAAHGVRESGSKELCVIDATEQALAARWMASTRGPGT